MTEHKHSRLNCFLKKYNSSSLLTEDNLFFKKEENENYVIYQVLIPSADIHRYRCIIDTKYTYLKVCSDDKILIELVLPLKEEISNEEYDRSQEASGLYKTIYGDQLQIEAEQWTLRYEKRQTIAVKGDIDFNFKTHIVKYFIDTIQNGQTGYDENQKQEIIDQLYAVHNFTYHPLNISVMPVTGGLNNKKYALAYDRFDTFIMFLKMYYVDRIQTPLLTARFYVGNRKALKDYLDSFFCHQENGKVALLAYCRKIYHIDDWDFIFKLCQSGQQPIDSAERVAEYLNLAGEYWKKKC